MLFEKEGLFESMKLGNKIGGTDLKLSILHQGHKIFQINISEIKVIKIQKLVALVWGRDDLRHYHKESLKVSFKN